MTHWVDLSFLKVKVGVGYTNSTTATDLFKEYRPPSEEPQKAKVGVSPRWHASLAIPISNRCVKHVADTREDTCGHGSSRMPLRVLLLYFPRK